MNAPRNLPAANNTTKAKSVHWLNLVERESNTPVSGMPLDTYLALENNVGLADALLESEDLADKLFGSPMFRAYYTRAGHSSKKSSIDWKSMIG